MPTQAVPNPPAPKRATPPVSPARALLASRPSQADRPRCAPQRGRESTGQGYATLDSGSDDGGIY